MLRSLVSSTPTSWITPSLRKPHKSRGFTIVELLIVIVVIAILAAITIVAYNGVQQRANNAAIIDAASKSVRMIKSYIAVNNVYPAVATNSCITSASGCLSTAGASVSVSTTFDTNIATIGTLPRGVPTSGSTRTGITYDYTSGRTIDGSTQPVAIFYWLFGTSQQCGVPNVVTLATWTSGTTSTTGYTTANDAGKTFCVVFVPGPAA